MLSPRLMRISQMKGVGRPSFRPCKFGRPQGYVARRSTRRPYLSRAKHIYLLFSSFCSQRQFWGRRMHNLQILVELLPKDECFFGCFWRVMS